MPAALLETLRLGPSPLSSGGSADPAALRIAAVVPSFRRGSGGHATVVALLRALREQGHEVSVWLEDSEGWHENPVRATVEFGESFACPEIPLRCDFAAWTGADVALATGWQTVGRVLRLPATRARAYLVQDHEPDFYPASAESLWAQWTYRQGLHAIAASPWLASLLTERYGCASTHFDLALDHDIYQAGGEEHSERLVVFYARASTPRRAVPLGLAALRELAARHPDLEIGLFGQAGRLDTGFGHTNFGALSPPQLAALYRRATVGMVLSVTNPSLVSLEMMASGLPCLELASESMVACFGHTGAPTLAAASPYALCESLELLLEDHAERERARVKGLELTSTRTWQQAGAQVIEGLRQALAEDGSDESGR